MKKKVVWIGAAVIVAGAAVGGVTLRGQDDEMPTVQTEAAARRKIVQTVNATGKIQPQTQVKISADVSAKITHLAVAEGQWVEKGDLLFELDKERYVASVESAEANVRSAQANANLVRENKVKTEKEFARVSELVKQSLESQAMLEAADAAYQVEVARFASARDQVAQSRAMLKQAKDELSKTTIYAPMAGTISDLNKEEGEIAIGSQFQEDVILIIADLNGMETIVNVDESDIVSVEIGQEAEIEVDALTDQKLHGVVSEIANSANASGQGTSDQKTEFEVTIDIRDDVASLRPGMTASADIFTKTNENALSVPIQSVAVRTPDQLERKEEEKPKTAGVAEATASEEEDDEPDFTADEDGFVEIVFCIEDGRAVARQVRTGIQSDEYIEVLEGLEEDDEVVTGSYRAISKDLTNGATVTIDNESNDDHEG